MNTMTIVGKTFSKRLMLPVITSIVCVLTTGLMSFAHARDLPPDPYESVMWENMAERFFPGDKVIFDERVKVIAPQSAEDQFHVPLTIDASEISDVVEVVAVADLNPIPHILTFRPKKAHAFLGFRLKLQQATAIHVGVRTKDDVWHIGAAYIDAAGGGCTAPAAVHGTVNWMSTLGQTRALARRDANGDARMTLRMRHPMDTGLASGIPAFFMNTITVRDQNQEVLAELELFEPVSENPTLTIKPFVSKNGGLLEVAARDNEGHEFGFGLSVPAGIDP